MVRGPAPSPIERVKDRYRYQIQLRSEDPMLVRHAARACRDNLADEARKHELRILVDVDAVDDNGAGDVPDPLQDIPDIFDIANDTDDTQNG